MKLSLNQALKQKNRLAGEITRLQMILRRENSRRNDNPSKVDGLEVWEDIKKTAQKLHILKAAICQANPPIYPAIEKMAELKSLINFLHTVPTKEGEEILLVGRNQEKLTYTWTSFFNTEKIDEMVRYYQSQIENLQDEIDAFNAQTHIDIPD